MSILTVSKLTYSHFDKDDIVDNSFDTLDKFCLDLSEEVSEKNINNLFNKYFKKKEATEKKLILFKKDLL